MKVELLGVRGSRCAPGPDFARVGGHTSSVLITPADPDGRRLVLDAGSGIADLHSDAPFDGDLLLTHLHWDHVQGLPFFAAGDTDRARVRVRLPAQGAARCDRPGSAAALLAESLSPPHFPIGPEQLRGNWTFDAIDEGRFEVGPLTVTAIEVPHKGGRTFGYRVHEAGVTLAYLPDYCPGGSAAACLAVAADADLLLLGGMFDAEESSRAAAFGHATISEARSLAAAARAGTAVLVHHSPTHTDDYLEARLSALPPQGARMLIGRQDTILLLH